MVRDSLLPVDAKKFHMTNQPAHSLYRHLVLCINYCHCLVFGFDLWWMKYARIYFQTYTYCFSCLEDDDIDLENNCSQSSDVSRNMLHNYFFFDSMIYDYRIHLCVLMGHSVVQRDTMTKCRKVQGTVRV